MGLGHEKLDVYRLSIGYVAWVYEKAGSLTGVHRPARDQWLRASQSILLNIAEGNGRTAQADRRRYFEIARGSALSARSPGVTRSERSISIPMAISISKKRTPNQTLHMDLVRLAPNQASELRVTAP